MSKKKAFSGSTMTLKDFHGGSIPSDLPLPSAPGVVVRPAAAAAFDHRLIPNAWGNPILRSDHRSRPGSSGTSRNYDEKPSFFSHPAHIIGRNFDEDERKPLDGLSFPRRTVSDESISVLPTRYEPKPESPSAAGRISKTSITSPVTQSSAVRFSGPANAQAHTTATASSVPNAWGTRKDVATVPEPVHSSNWSGPNAVSRFAQASALDKVSSGRWQSKHIVTQQPDIEVIRYQDDTDFPSNRVHNSFNGMSLVSDKGDYHVTRGRYAEKNSIIEDEKTAPLYYDEGKERSSSFTHDVVRPATLSTHVPAEAMERPKIKLLPRSKPVEPLESSIVDYRQGYQIPLNTAHVEAVSESYANEISAKPGSSGSEGGKKAVERPRLNLKPRSQPLEQSDSITERERKSLFGGARPRELVLKERGIDDDVINNLDVIQSPNRVKQQEHPKTEVKPEAMVENLQHDHKSGRKADSSWRNENNWRTNREQERRHEPDTWRKPIAEQPNSPPPDSGVRYGKAASALELAQAFSRSNSGVKSVPVPGRNQIPFSRLTAADTRDFYSGPTSRRQINGY